MQIIILTSHSQSLVSVDLICKDIINIYLELQSAHITVKVYDIDDKNFKSRNFESDNKYFFICVHPGVIRSPALLVLSQTMKKEDKLIIHVYGDFVRQASFFYEVQKHLINKQVLFLPPTITYSNLIKKLITNTDSIISIPFPVDLESFNFNSHLKKKHGITTETVFVYGGRISRQKNVEQLLEWFNTLNSINGYKLFVIGKFDDFEVGNVGNNFKLGELYQRLQKLKSTSVVFLHHLPHEELYSYYQMADYFVSFSTYHDEDFGRAPIEAILCGTPCLLTDWGGYRDLAEEFPNFVEPFRTYLRPEGIEIIPSLELKLKKKIHLRDIHKFKSKYSNSSFKISILNIMNAEFPLYSGATDLLVDLATNNRSFFYKKNGDLNIKNYKKLYQGFGSVI